MFPLLMFCLVVHELVKVKVHSVRFHPLLSVEGSYYVQTFFWIHRWDMAVYIHNLMIYMKKFLDCDWLREMQFLGNTVQKKGN